MQARTSEHRHGFWFVAAETLPNLACLREIVVRVRDELRKEAGLSAGDETGFAELDLDEVVRRMNAYALSDTGTPTKNDSVQY
mmetsp:Transcript_3179/g.10531  ORF Transcript_3179/g.10531 Transcript_3179/m.10531 type:complete len:83 (-) Transcript_3179:519-767(-)